MKQKQENRKSQVRAGVRRGDGREDEVQEEGRRFDPVITHQFFRRIGKHATDTSRVLYLER